MITIVEPTTAQRITIRSWWVRAIVGRQPREREPFGAAHVAGHVALVSARELVERLEAECEVRVAELEAVPGEALGFVAWEPASARHPISVHMVYVLGPDQPHGGRRLGYGSALLRHAVGSEPYRACCWTPAGTALMRAMERKAAA